MAGRREYGLQRQQHGTFIVLRKTKGLVRVWLGIKVSGTFIVLRKTKCLVRADASMD